LDGLSGRLEDILELSVGGEAFKGIDVVHEQGTGAQAVAERIECRRWVGLVERELVGRLAKGLWSTLSCGCQEHVRGLVEIPGDLDNYRLAIQLLCDLAQKSAFPSGANN
jgi:hypothetical protein